MNNLAFITNFLSGGDGIIILVIVLIIFGPKKLPELARGMGQAIKEFNKAKDEVERELTKPEVNVQPAQGQQPRMAELPTVPPPAVTPTAQAPAPMAASPINVPPINVPPINVPPINVPSIAAPPVAPPPVSATPVQETHPAGQA
jgi:sec-independent protein translocase protein TatA